MALSLRSFGLLLGLVAIEAGAFAIGAKLVVSFKAVHANFGLKIFYRFNRKYACYGACMN